MGFLCALAFAGRAAEWKPVGTLNIPPKYNFTFLAATPSGDLLAATFHSASSVDQPADIPALLIHNPMGTKPEIVELCRTMFNPNRGYGGIACDPQGRFYVSGDTGDPSTSFIKKFNPDGSPDTTFGQNGEIHPGKRCLGLDVVGEYLMMAVDWGVVHVYASRTGKPEAQFPRGAEQVYVRDIAVEPKSMKVFGVAAGSVVLWEGGNPWEPAKYRFRVLTPRSGEVRSGEGISLDPATGSALVTPVLGNTLLEVRADGSVLKTTIPTATPGSHLADSVLSFDGTTLFISDVISKQIHVLKRGMADEQGGGASPAIPVPPILGAQASGAAEPGNSSSAPPAPPIVVPPASAAQTAVADARAGQWYNSYTTVVESARKQGLPMVVYFRRAGFKKCEDFEASCLLQPAFTTRAQRFVCVFEDMSANRLLGYKFGVFRIPHLLVLDKNGETSAAFTYNIRPEELFKAMDAMR